MTKSRPAQKVAEIGYVIGDIKGKTAVIVDDIIDSAGTLCAAAQTVLDEGAARVYAVATHGLFSGKAYENLAAVPFEQIVVTDTVPLPGRIRQRRRPVGGRTARGFDHSDLHRRPQPRVQRRQPAVLRRARDACWR
jgi:phosphoribosylpyrophosphate synthetase